MDQIDRTDGTDQPRVPRPTKERSHLDCVKELTLLALTGQGPSHYGLGV